MSEEDLRVIEACVQRGQRGDERYNVPMHATTLALIAEIRRLNALLAEKAET